MLCRRPLPFPMAPHATVTLGILLAACSSGSGAPGSPPDAGRDGAAPDASLKRPDGGRIPADDASPRPAPDGAASPADGGPAPDGAARDSAGDAMACDEGTLALDCGLYAPVYCTGEEDQSPPACATSCSSDDDCADAAYCSNSSVCAQRHTAGDPCSRDRQCQPSLSCADSICCATPCEGECRACDVPGSEGTCTDLDDPADQLVCGEGACERSVQACAGGEPQECVEGTPEEEVCNGIDDDCDGTVDNGHIDTLCPPVPNAGRTCHQGECVLTHCHAGWYDVNGEYDDGCECQDDSHGDTCSTATSLGTLSSPGMTVTRVGVLPLSFFEDWFSVSFPAGPGSPRIRLTEATPSGFSFALYESCFGGPMSCPPLAQCTRIRDWSAGDTWPATIWIRVTRSASAGGCAPYTLAVSR